MQSSDSERRVGVDVMRRRMSLPGGVNMYMFVMLPVVGMFVRVDPQGGTNAPKANTDEHYADEAFAPI